MAKQNSTKNITELVLSMIEELSPSATDEQKAIYKTFAAKIKQNQASIDTNPQALMDSFNLLGNTPEGRAQLEKLVAGKNIDFKNKELAGGMRLLADIGGVVAARDQVRTADRAIAGLKRTGVPGVPGKNRSLQGALSEAQRDVAAAGSLEGGLYDRQVNEGLLADLDVAQTASTGQAGAYASNAQTAIARRNRSRLQGAQVRQQARGQALSNRNRLIGQDIGEDQANFANRSANLAVQDQRYNADLAMADRLGNVGRQNTLNGVDNALDSFGQVSSNRRVSDYSNNTAPGAMNPPNTVAPANDSVFQNSYTPFNGAQNQGATSYMDSFDQNLQDNTSINSYMPNIGSTFEDVLTEGWRNSIGANAYDNYQINKF
jgi:hypothetical protein